MGGNLERRLTKLQLILGERGCPACERWHRTEVRIIAPPSTDPTGRTEAISPSRPDTCPSCGRRAPTTTAVVQIIAPDDDDTEGAA